MSALSDFFDAEISAISPSQEVLCYEAIWSEVKGVRFKDLGERLQKRLPSDACDRIPHAHVDKIEQFLNSIEAKQYNVLIRETADYPKRLHPIDVPILYYMGDVSLLDSPCISIVGARKASERGRMSARIIANALAHDGYTVVSGLAAGIDTAAHSEIITYGGRTIGVIGTPINQSYPKENASLQEIIARKHLLISHVPFFKYSQQDYRINRGFFPERNRIMAALSEATIIAEASDTSGSLIQAREAHRLQKKIIILKPSYDNPRLSWPKTYVSKYGAYVAETAKEIKEILGR